MKTGLTPIGRAVWTAVTGLLVITGPVTAAYQLDSSERDLFSLSLSELQAVKVTSSTLTAKNLKSVPSSITVFNRDQIRNLGADYLFEVLNYVPGFQAYRQGEGSTQYFFSARGHRSSTKSREVLILIDGVRLNREFDNASAVPMLALHNVEKIEFIRGPGSALYGSNAFLGVIDITTVKNKNQLQLAAGENNKKQLSALGSITIADWQLDISAHLFDEKGEDLPLENYFTLARERGKDPRSGEDVQVSLQHEGTLLRASYYQRKAEDFYVTERSSEEFNLSTEEHSSFQVQQKVEWQPAFFSVFSAGYADSTYAPDSFFGPLGSINADQEEENFDAKVHNQWDYAADWSFQFGLEYRHSDISEFVFKTENIGDSELYPSKTQEVASGYLQSQQQLGDGLELILGARYDRYANIGSALSPRVGLVNQLSNHHTVKFLYGEAFRAPTVNELYLQTFSGAVAGNPSLDPETIKTWEMIWVGQWQDVNMTVNGFYNVLEDAIVRDDTLVDSNFLNLTSDESFYGVEVEYGFQITENWLLNATATHLRNLPEADFRQTDWLGSIVINYSYERWNISLSGTYADEREMVYGNDRLSLGGYGLANSKIQYSASNNISVYLAATNLLDKVYGTPTQRTEHSEPIPNRGRELTLGLSLAFD